ncbi:MAG: dUTP diphosphatase [Bacteroidia bacterium]|nr:dUTP diphosphatase [Bacteroidia bacterium]
MTVKVKNTSSNPLPTYQTIGASGMDLFAAHDVTLELGRPVIVYTGLHIELPQGYEAQIRPRSGLSTNGVYVAFGTVDADYRGEIGVIMTYLRLSENPRFQIVKGQRIAQLVIAPVIQCQWVETSELTPTTRNHNGFGSTGL